MVVPHAGTWIEITLVLPLTLVYYVVPHAGTWIEILISAIILLPPHVVPHAGTWIEINLKLFISGVTESFPTRERGLKFW